MKYDVVIIGGGAAGMFLAAALPANIKVALLESNDRVGKKLLATGNGKCNLTNLDMNIAHYNRPGYIEEFLDTYIRTASALQQSLTCFVAQWTRRAQTCSLRTMSTLLKTSTTPSTCRA